MRAKEQIAHIDLFLRVNRYFAFSLTKNDHDLLKKTTE